MTFGEAVRAWMEHRNFTMQQLSRASGVPYATIYRLVRGTHHSLSVMDAVKVARALGTTVETLADGRGPGEAGTAEEVFASQAGTPSAVGVAP